MDKINGTMKTETKMKAKKKSLDFITFEIVQKKGNHTWKYKMSQSIKGKLGCTGYSRSEVKTFKCLKHNKVRS